MSEHISPEEFKRRFPGASMSAIAANALEWARMVKTDWSKVPIGPGPFPEGLVTGPAPVIKSMKRIRQSSKPLLNKTEERLYAYLKAFYPSLRIHAQAKKVRVANGCWYTVDFYAVPDCPTGRPLNWECKGDCAWDDAIVKLKVAATTYPDEAWFLMWEDGTNNWLTQEVLP